MTPSGEAWRAGLDRHLPLGRRHPPGEGPAGRQLPRGEGEPGVHPAVLGAAHRPGADGQWLAVLPVEGEARLGERLITLAAVTDTYAHLLQATLALS
jgi:hypothetical protein